MKFFLQILVCLAGLGIMIYAFLADFYVIEGAWNWDEGNVRMITFVFWVVIICICVRLFWFR